MFGYLLASGLTLGALYALVAVGLVIVVKSTSVVNLAQGEMFMVGGFFGFLFHVQLGLPYLAALGLAVVAAFLLGGLVYQAAFRPLMKAGLVPVLLACIAVSFILKGTARAIWGGVGDYIPFPPMIAGAPIRFAGVIVLPQQVVVLGFSIALLVAVAAFFRFTAVGNWMQAMADNVKAATLVGIPIDRLQQLAFALSAAAAGAAAVLMAPLTQLYPDIGFGLFIKAFAGAVLGGLTSLPGAVLGGFLVGLIEAFVAGYVGSKYQDVAPFVVIMFALLFMPRGILGGAAMRKI
ncbi:branched-chain amino acid ABC transporter permease [Enterovirga sp. CN4-39]|uniref:branched-chain amino acid ABC transporter permease n=1 Tax=Enterovirga sp. CN4-39 TaxID=3400910 RepID=UPI003C0FAFF5